MIDQERVDELARQQRRCISPLCSGQSLRLICARCGAMGAAFRMEGDTYRVQLGWGWVQATDRWGKPEEQMRCPGCQH